MAAKILMLALSPTMESGTIVRWAVPEGTHYGAGDVLCEVETDKATMDYEATSGGTLLRTVVPAGAKVRVGDIIAISGNVGEDISALLGEAGGTTVTAGEKTTDAPVNELPVPDGPPKDDTGTASETEHLPDGVRASPLARAMAREKGIPLSRVKGSGPGGRVVKADIEKYAAAGTGLTEKKIAVLPASGDTVVTVSEKRKVIARRLTESKVSSPHYYLTVNVLMDTLLAARVEINNDHHEKLSLNAFLIRLVAEALKRHPEVNASWEGDTIIRHGRVDIALAVAQPDGLVTPVIRDAANKGIAQIDRELRDLIERAREGRLAPEEYSDATFTISNLGSFGVREFAAIINPPNAAILAVGEIFREPFEEKNGGVGFRSAMKCTLSCDHRVIDGAVAAEFAADMRRLIERPVIALL